MIKIDVIRMARILGVKTPEEFDEELRTIPRDTYGIVLREAIDEGCSDEEAEEKAMAAEDAELAELVRKYESDLVSIFENEAANLKLEISALKTKPGVYAITPKDSWAKSAQAVRSIVHGIAGWWFPSFREFLDSGPYTPRQAVDAHLGYLGEQWKLYGYASPQRRLL